MGAQTESETFSSVINNERQRGSEKKVKSTYIIYTINVYVRMCRFLCCGDPKDQCVNECV